MPVSNMPQAQGTRPSIRIDVGPRAPLDTSLLPAENRQSSTHKQFEFACALVGSKVFALTPARGREFQALVEFDVGTTHVTLIQMHARLEGVPSNSEGTIILVDNLLYIFRHTKHGRCVVDKFDLILYEFSKIAIGSQGSELCQVKEEDRIHYHERTKRFVVLSRCHKTGLTSVCTYLLDTEKWKEPKHCGRPPPANNIHSFETYLVRDNLYVTVGTTCKELFRLRIDRAQLVWSSVRFPTCLMRGILQIELNQPLIRFTGMNLRMNFYDSGRSALKADDANMYQKLLQAHGTPVLVTIPVRVQSI